LLTELTTKNNKNKHTKNKRQVVEASVETILKNNKIGQILLMMKKIT
jgi:hypothetical protein